MMRRACIPPVVVSGPMYAVYALGAAPGAGLSESDYARLRNRIAQAAAPGGLARLAATTREDVADLVAEIVLAAVTFPALKPDAIKVVAQAPYDVRVRLVSQAPQIAGPSSAEFVAIVRAAGSGVPAGTTPAPVKNAPITPSTSVGDGKVPGTRKSLPILPIAAGAAALIAIVAIWRGR